MVMGTCDHSGGPPEGSPQTILDGETSLSLDNGSGTSPRVGDGVVLPSELCCLNSGDDELDINDACERPLDGDLNCHGTSDFDYGKADDYNPDLGNVSSIELGMDRMCFDEMHCTSDTNQCPSDQMDCSSQWVEPVSNAIPCCSESDGELGLLEVEERHTRGDHNFGATVDFYDNHADVSQLENMSVIEAGLSRVRFDVIQSKSEMIPCASDHMNHSGEPEVPSRLEQVACSAASSGSHDTVGGDNPSMETLLEVAPDMPSIGVAVDDQYSKDMTMPNGLLLDRALVFGGSDHAGKQAEGSGRTDDDVSKLDCADASSSSLRRSSRTRKCVQKDQGGKRATKSTKKGSDLSHCGIIDLLSKATRKKRSCLSRSLCSTAWGLPGNLSKYFDCSDGATVNKVLDKASQRGKAGQRSKKKNTLEVAAASQINTLKVAAASQISEPMLIVPCRPIRLKVTFGKKVEEKKEAVTTLQVVDSQSIPLSCNDGNKPELSSYSEKDSGKPNCLDTVQLEPQKAVSSHAGKYMDPGTSPDSEVIDQVADTNMAQSTPTVPLSHNPVNITSEGTVPGNDSFPSKNSRNKKNKKDKLSETSNVGIEDKTICQDSMDKGKKKKKNKKDKLREGSDLGTEDKVLSQAGVGKAKSKKGGRHKLSTAFCFKDTGTGASDENPLSNVSGSELASAEHLSVSEKLPNMAPSLDNSADNNADSHTVAGIEPNDSGNLFPSLSPDGVEGKRILEGLKAKGKSKSKSKVTDGTKKQRDPSGQLKGNKRKGKSKSRQKEENDSLVQANDKESLSQTGKYDMLDVRKTVTDNGVVLENVSCMDVLPAEGGERTMPSAWVCCDDCLKWRCIPAKLADIIEETHCKWTCKDNQDKAFADCSIPQEKSNAEINAELQISDEEDGRDGYLGSKGGGIRHAIDVYPLTASQPSTWMLIKSNLFLHRSRKTQTMDEIMVCHCKPPAQGSFGCGNQCLNRMLNIECVQGTCPCGDLCSNQQFQKRQYAKLSWFRCGKKGYGLQASEDISNGQFLIEYVGEVLDLQAYEARQKEYASKGYKHFYFMTLNGNEVIDACAKGNLGRFVNHSCDPNCRTEKWVVNGEICVGLFALKNIKKGEELTFDYNYVRVFGAAAKKCHCGSLKCRGYIGGDPNNADVIVQGDSDEEFPEPVVIDENGEIDHTLEDVMAKSRSEDVKLVPNAHDLCQENLEVTMEDTNKVNEIDIDGPSPASSKKQEGDEVRQSPDNLVALQNVRDEAMSSVDQLGSLREHTTSASISSTVSDVLPVKRIVKNSLSGSSDSSGKISEVDFVECERSPPKPRPRMKISRPSKAVKDQKSNSNSSNAEKVLFPGHRTQLLSHKPKKLAGGSANGHLEAVEGKLNELLDADGGICKRKDASKGYLKLLLLTAASGDSGNGGAIQSNRDLSMILDAMLKTKSRGLLLDIINKNGLQMLHNMMKLYRRDFKKIPILRKLLKVLEFLAEKEILTVERINENPLRPGVESFRASILSLTDHDDKKVHQIARNFRDRWVPRPIRKFNGVEKLERKFNGIEKLDRKREFNRISDSNRFFGVPHHRREHVAKRTDAIDCIKQSEASNSLIDAKVPEALPAVSATPTQTVTSTIQSQARKRKSRWDQDKRPRTCSQKLKTSPDKSEGAPSCSGSTVNLAEASLKADDPMHQDDDDDDDDDAPPPGFSSSHISEEDAPPPGFSSLQMPKEAPCVLKYPCAVSKGYVQERFNSHLPVSYGIPFSMVQQLGSPESEAVDSWVIAPAIPFQPYPPLPPYPRRDEGVPSTSGSGVISANALNPGPTNQYMVHQERGFFNSPGPGPGPVKRFNRQQNWGNNNNQGPKWRPPWLKRRNGWGFKGNYPRNGTFMGGGRIMANGHEGPQLVDVNHSVEFARNSC